MSASPPSELTKVLARAIETAPQPWVRNNKGRDDGLLYEVGYADDAPLSDETIHIVAAYGTAEHETAVIHRDRLAKELQVRAQLAALDAAGYQIVPKGLTVGMVRAATGDAGPLQGLPRRQKAFFDSWNAALAAAPKP